MRMSLLMTARMTALSSTTRKLSSSGAAALC